MSRVYRKLQCQVHTSQLTTLLSFSDDPTRTISRRLDDGWTVLLCTRYSGDLATTLATTSSLGLYDIHH